MICERGVSLSLQVCGFPQLCEDVFDQKSSQEADSRNSSPGDRSIKVNICVCVAAEYHVHNNFPHAIRRRVEAFKGQFLNNVFE